MSDVPKFSQKNEDQIIAEIVGDQVGLAVEIGAYDGETYSNTRALYLAGWSLILVEPAIEAFRGLLATYESAGDQVTLVHAVVGSSRPASGLTWFWNNPTAYSTTVSSQLKKFWNQPFYKPCLVPVVTWTSLLAYGLADCKVLSIDTEGTSRSLLVSYPFDISKPLVICVEHDQRPDDCWRVVEPYGYREIARNSENVIYRLT